MVKQMMHTYLLLFRQLLENSFFPGLQPAIAVGSAFEGWSPSEEDVTYCMLMPLVPPKGHTFHLELGAAGEMLSKNSQIRVELGCTCTEGPMEEMLCFLHHPEEELRENQAPSLLHTLCTGSYLDAQKTAHWFHQLVITSWVLLPWSSQYNLKMLPCGRSCKFHMTKGNQKVLSVEIIFGVQLGDSDIYLSSQTAEPGLIPSTMWPQSCVVAEAKFFREMAREVPYNSFHLKCLQICARILEGTAFSTYTFKMVVMHLLTTIPPSDWCREHFLLRLLDIMRYLRCCLQEKRLDHIFFGNEHVPEEIDLPPAFRTAEPPNLFQHLAQDPAAHAEAMREFHYLRER
ncbi:IPIL1 protein, partial [Rhynochetos jubatus]|nr:IPIL1 protein [Rhynochetos jubatus]